MTIEFYKVQKYPNFSNSLKKILGYYSAFSATLKKNVTIDLMECYVKVST